MIYHGKRCHFIVSRTLVMVIARQKKSYSQSNPDSQTGGGWGGVAKNPGWGGWPNLKMSAQEVKLNGPV